MAKISTQHHMFASAHFVTSSAVIASLSAQSQTPVEDPVSSSSSCNSVPNAYNYGYHFDGRMAIVILIAASIFLILGVFVFHIKNCFAPTVSPTLQPAVDRRLGQKNEGLDREFIETFPVVAYSATSMAKNCTECAVCLTEFQEAEKTRLLPKCNHVFHPECIDMWLLSHSTCPLCRIILISESHTITIQSNLSQGSATQENLDGAAPVIEMEIEAPSEASLGLNNAVERAEEREAFLALSRRSQSCQQAALELDNQERASATSARHWSSMTMDERSTSSRWINRLRRSSSLEGSRSSAKVEDPDYCGESLVEEDRERGDALPQESGVAVAFRGTPSFYSRSCSERITHISGLAEQREVINDASRNKQGSELE